MKHVLLYKKCGLAGIRTRNISSLLTATASSYATISPHPTCFTLQRKHQVVPNRGTVIDFL